MREDGAQLKNPGQDPNLALDIIRQIENTVAQPNFDLEQREDIPVQIRVNEQVGPAMFKADPLIPGGYIANSLTIRAMRPDIFVLGDSLDDLIALYACGCGKEFDAQFWKLCPYCGRDLKI